MRFFDNGRMLYSLDTVEPDDMAKHLVLGSEVPKKIFEGKYTLIGKQVHVEVIAEHFQGDVASLIAAHCTLSWLQLSLIILVTQACTAPLCLNFSTEYRRSSCTTLWFTSNSLYWTDKTATSANTTLCAWSSTHQQPYIEVDKCSCTTHSCSIYSNISLLPDIVHRLQPSLHTIITAHHHHSISSLLYTIITALYHYWLHTIITTLPPTPRSTWRCVLGHRKGKPQTAQQHGPSVLETLELELRTRSENQCTAYYEATRVGSYSRSHHLHSEALQPRVSRSGIVLPLCIDLSIFYWSILTRTIYSTVTRGCDQQSQ